MKTLSPPSDIDAIRDMQTNSSSSFDDEVEQASVSSGETVDSDLTPFLKGRPPAKPVQHGSARSAEKIIKNTRKMRWLDGFKDVKWDSDEATGVTIDRFQAIQLRNNACEITWTCWPAGASSPVEYFGQGGLVRGPDVTVKFLTAQPQYLQRKKSRWCMGGGPKGASLFHVKGRCNRMLNIPRTGWERTKEWTNRNAYCLGNGDVLREMLWNYGVDISQLIC